MVGGHRLEQTTCESVGDNVVRENIWAKEGIRTQGYFTIL